MLFWTRYEPEVVDAGRRPETRTEVGNTTSDAETSRELDGRQSRWGVIGTEGLDLTAHIELKLVGSVCASRQNDRARVGSTSPGEGANRDEWE